MQVMYSVSPHPRGVDRNSGGISIIAGSSVSPHPRGVDRNSTARGEMNYIVCLPSPEGSG